MSSLLKMSRFLQTILATAGPPVITSTSNLSTIEWTDCSPNPSTQLKCANFSVPLDWSKPDEQHINLALGMIPAANASQRIGYLMMNPGGPGVTPLGPNGTGDLGLSPNGEYWRSSQLHQYFDIVGPDPRGVGLSTPIKCDPELWNTAYQLSLFPENEDSYNEMLSVWEAAGKSCAEQSGKLLNHVDTKSVARDFEAIRLALGDELMNLIGFSYGTQVGSQYAELYPDNIRAMVLDGILDHTQDETYSLVTEMGGYEASLKSFFNWCAGNNSCAFHDTPHFPTSFDNFITAANLNPIPAPQCHNTSSPRYPCYPTATGYDILAILQGLLCFPFIPNGYGTSGLAGTSELLHTAFLRNDTSFFSTQNISTMAYDYAFTAITCQDWKRTLLSWPEYHVKMHMASIIAPHTRGQSEFWRLQARCMNWPAPVVNLPHSIESTFQDRKLKTPVLLVNALWDPATAYPWAVSLARQFGERNAVLMSRNGSGHTSWYYKGDTHFAVNNYLIGLKVPEPATVLQS